MSMNHQSKIIMGLGLVLILATGLIHIVDASESFADAAYLGWLFYANGLAAVIAALGIWRGEHAWGWHCGAGLAAVTLLGYLASRTVGLPQLPAEPSAWLEPLGVAALLAEAGFLMVYGLTIRSSAARPPQMA
jgi:hypothetical protein